MGIYNRGRYSNVRFDKMVTEASSTLDAVKREKMFFDISALVARDVAMIPMYYEVNSWAGRKGLKYLARSDGQTLAQNVSKK
jgi:peptide/nickel transport system substrate-binding protein